MKKGLKGGKKDKTWKRDKALNIFTSSFLPLLLITTIILMLIFLQKVKLFHHDCYLIKLTIVYETLNAN